MTSDGAAFSDGTATYDDKHYSNPYGKLDLDSNDYSKIGLVENFTYTVTITSNTDPTSTASEEIYFTVEYVDPCTITEFGDWDWGASLDDITIEVGQSETVDLSFVDDTKNNNSAEIPSGCGA